jgi:tetratricopeptide (TPR) repeat protein
MSATLVITTALSICFAANLRAEEAAGSNAAVEDTKKAGKLDPKTGDDYLELAWNQLFNRKPREAIAASLKALKLSPANAAMIKTNLSHGYLLDNQFDKAKAIYLEKKDAQLPGDQRTFSEVVLDDFSELEKAGISHPDMEKIKALLKFKFPSPDGRFSLRTKDGAVQLIENDSDQVIVDLGGALAQAGSGVVA